MTIHQIESEALRLNPSDRAKLAERPSAVVSRQRRAVRILAVMNLRRRPAYWAGRAWSATRHPRVGTAPRAKVARPARR